MDDTLSPVPAVAPTPSQFGMQARVEIPALASLGDTVSLTIHVTWTDAPHPWLLLPQTSPEGTKLSQLGMAMEQTRSIVNGKESPEIVIRYKLLAKDTGLAQIPALSFDIPVQEGGAMHLITVPQNLQIEKPTSLLPWLGGSLGFLLVGIVAFAFWKRRANRNLTLANARQQERALRSAFETLADRVQSADPRSWMLELEQFVAQAPAVENPSEEQLLAQKKLQESFAQSRYGGGPRDSWELKEWLRTARIALQFNRDDQEE